MVSPESLDILRPQQESLPTSLLPESLRLRDFSTRFETPEKIILAKTLREAWSNLPAERRVGEIIPIRMGETIINGVYKNNSPKIWLPREKIDPEQWQYLEAPLEKDNDLAALQSYLWQKDIKHCIIGSFDFPSQLGDRNVSVNGGVFEEGVIIGSYMRSLAAHNVKGKILFDNHSPVTSFLALHSGIRTMDLSTLPLLLGSAIDNGWVNRNDKIVIAPFDDGAKERGWLIKYLLTNQQFSTNLVQGEKIKNGDEKTVTFKRSDKHRFIGATVIVPEDRLISGGTLLQGLEKLYQMGAKKVVILVPYAECINGAAEDLKNYVDSGKLSLVITDGITPRTSLDGIQPGLMVVPVKHLIQEVFELDRQGTDFWHPDGLFALAKLGLAHNPWQTELLIPEKA